MHTHTHTHRGRASLVAQTVKNLSAMWETCVLSLSWGDPQRRKWQPIPVFLPGEPPWTEDPGGLWSIGSQNFGNPMDCSLPASTVHGGSPGKNTGVGCHALLQGIFPTQGLNPGLPCCRQIVYHLSHQGSPWILEWIAYPISWGLSLPRNRTGVSCSTGGFFISWATGEAHDPETWQ